jgi:CheY-like chemotaxis protein
MPHALIIDDNRQMADNLRKMLKLLGVDANIALSARSGIRNVEKSPDVVFLDINMPGVDGFEVLRYIRRQPILDKTPVVFVTSDDQQETKRKAMEMGAKALIVKPPSVEGIEQILKELKVI